VVVARRTTGGHHKKPRSHDLDAWNHRFDGNRHLLEKPRITTRVMAINRQLRTPRLRIATALTATNSINSRGG